MKPLWQNVEQKAPDELVGSEHHCAVPRLPAAAIILVAEGHAARIESKEATVRDGDAMGVAGEIGQHRLRPGEGRLAVDKPFLPLERCEMCGKAGTGGKAPTPAEESRACSGIVRLPV